MKATATQHPAVPLKTLLHRADHHDKTKGMADMVEGYAIIRYERILSAMPELPIQKRKIENMALNLYGSVLLQAWSSILFLVWSQFFGAKLLYEPPICPSQINSVISSLTQLVV